ncbi:adenosine kinase [Acinetobacter qingfengensis]|uniref:Sugar kinase n=1 Tax=Acinetobacter qingfengensis TaxID=1262585 RepID=A0A1E7RE73_9GAMM|nr:adenosine kinase [Acinetobacter qingfengensis]KAA8734408.1 adenosine kinase [Acinetobacter qingfengensis]OEY97583.1 sugar kinase [Acinetobacter qingfengensis]
MSAVELFSIGNALVDQEFLVNDQFLVNAGLAKGTMQLCDAQQQQQLVEHLVKASHKGQASGGSAANTTVAFTALGGSAFYACRVGNDALAEFYLDDLQKVGVKTASSSLSEGQTGTCIVMITPEGERTMYTHLGITAELSPQQIDYVPLKQASWLYIEGYLATSPTAHQAVLQARTIAKQHQVKIALSLSDPAMVQYAREGLDILIAEGVDVLFCNEQEALMYTKAITIEQASEALLNIAQTVVITLGNKGALIAKAGQTIQLVVGESVEAIDSNGAGDAFAGGFLYALSNNKTPEQAAKLGNRVAAQVVSQYGPRLTQAQYQQIAQQI